MTPNVGQAVWCVFGTVGILGVLLMVLGVVMTRRGASSPRVESPQSPAPVELAYGRLQRGEITQAEYDEIVRTLRG